MCEDKCNLKMKSCTATGLIDYLPSTDPGGNTRIIWPSTHPSHIYIAIPTDT